MGYFRTIIGMAAAGCVSRHRPELATSPPLLLTPDYCPVAAPRPSPLAPRPSPLAPRDTLAPCWQVTAFGSVIATMSTAAQNSPEAKP